ncbi:uncharacterized protein FRV6_05534 [Fusarium oxysporum]|uniref:Uncharacterized protein n=1 Tax=Fusarium oxysporum TaxID=5507 RepID=A0A2H3SYR8_FUSOX|nr:uncharacterized protein FRV6_05534 [Fusarium oxysporum]
MSHASEVEKLVLQSVDISSPSEIKKISDV